MGHLFKLEILFIQRYLIFYSYSSSLYVVYIISIFLMKCHCVTLC